MVEQWLSIVEYARTFTTSDMTIRRRIKTGKLPAVLKNGKYFIPVSVDENGTPYREVRSNAPASGPLELTPRQMPPRYPESRIVSPQASAESDLLIVKKNTVPHSLGQKPIDTSFPKYTANNPNFSKKPLPPTQHAPVFNMPDEDRTIPSNIWRPVAERGSVTVESQNLLSFCESVVTKLSQTEKRIEQEYKEKIAALEAKLTAKEFEISQLRQQVDDLQLLAKILERKKTPA